MKFVRFVLMVAAIGLSSISATMAQNAAPTADFANIAKLEQFEPAQNEIACRGEVSATVLVSSAPEEIVDFFGFLTVNGLPAPPFTLTLLPGDISVREKLHWPVEVRGKTVAVRFRFIAIGKSSNKGYQVAEISKDYNRGRIRRGKPFRPGC